MGLNFVLVTYCFQMEKALANMALKSVDTAMAATMEQKQLNVASPRPSPSSALKGVSQSLLERVSLSTRF